MILIMMFFILKNPKSSWTLNSDVWDWEAPLPYPDDGERYIWNQNAHERDNTTGWELAPVIFDKAISPKDWRAIKDYDTWSPGSFKQDKWVLHWHGPAVTLKDPYEVMRAVEDFHINGRGWRGFAYGYAIAPDGTLFRGREEKNRKPHSLATLIMMGSMKTKRESLCCFMFGEGQEVTKEAFGNF